MASDEVKKFHTLTAYAQHREVSVPAVSKAIREGRLRESVAIVGGKWKVISFKLADLEWAASTRGPAHTAQLEAAAGVPPLAASLARREAARAELAEIEVEEKRGRLVPIEEARQVMTDKFSAVRTRLLGVSAKVKQRLPHVAAEDVRVINDLVRAALEEIADGRDGDAE